MNGDGKTDIATALDDDGGVVALLLNNGDGTFAPAQYFSANSNATSVAIDDLNGDGSVDLAVTSQGLSSSGGGAVTVFLNAAP